MSRLTWVLGRGGWTSSYPETAGYIIPTFLALARELGDSRFLDGAARDAAWHDAAPHHEPGG